MEEIKIGNFIRTKTGKIYKIDKIDKCPICKEKEYINIEIKGDLHFENTYHKKDIVKNSQNIIDLVEEGDYVNGYKVIDVLENLETGELHLEMPMDYTNKELGDCTIYNKDIKDVVTKEQFNHIKYIVGDE